MIRRLSLAAAFLVSLLGLGLPPLAAQAQIAASVASACASRVYAAGQSRPVTITTAGDLCTNGTTASVTGSAVNNADAVASATNLVPVQSNLYVYNGATWDRQRGSTSGSFGIIRDAAGNARGANVNSANQLQIEVCSVTPACADVRIPLATANGELTAVPGLNTFANVNLYNGTTSDFQKSIQGATATGVGTGAVSEAPSSAAGAATAPVMSAAVETGHVIKASAGNLYSLNCTSGASAGYCLVFNSTTVPAAGAVTPVKCYVIAANSTVNEHYYPPVRLGTGISVAFSTTGCFTKTDSATAFISAEGQ